MHTYTKEEEDKMILDAFHDLQKAYGASNHKHKFELVAKAFEFASKAHEGVKRRNGEPYCTRWQWQRYVSKRWGSAPPPSVRLYCTMW